MTIDGKAVTLAQRVCWHPDDDPRLKQTVVIGRARVELDGGRESLDAILVASADPRCLGARFAMFFEPWSGRLVAVELS